MRAARSVGLRDVRVEEVPDPAAGPDGVVVRVLACGVCGSDVSDDWVARKLPAVLGHELVGVVEEVGAEVAGVRVGDRVVVHHHAPCGTCALCAAGRETLCPAFRATAVEPGGFAERVRVPGDLLGELLVTDLDPDVATFVEPLACVLRALDRCAVGPDDRLLVLGCGVGGLLALAAAGARGVTARAAFDPRPGRLARAVELGAVALGGDRPATHPRGGAPGRSTSAEGFDVVLVCAPGHGAVADGLAALAPGGRLGLYATPKAGDLPLDGPALYALEAQVVPSYSAGPGDMRAAHDLLRAGAVDPRPWITHRLPLDRTGDALELARSGEALKAVVVP